jgi:autotransporter-associated beta strand protein
MVFTPGTSANLGLPSATNNAEQVNFLSAPATSSTSAVANMLPGYYVEGTAHRFVTYGANGVTPVADGSMVAFTPGMTAGSAVVNVTATTSLPDFNPVIYALRGGNVTLNSPTGANNDATITLAGGGADVGSVISTAATFTINPNLKFGSAGTNEALIYAGGTMQINGNITAGSITKFGAGQLNIGNDQSDAARGAGNGYSGGWVVNEGSINLITFGSAGNAAPLNTIVLNGNQSSTPTLFLRANPADTLLNYTYTSGSIIAVDNATIDFDPGADDRVHTIADVEIQQSGGIGNATANGPNDAILRIVNNRNRSILAAGQLTLTNNAILNVDATNVGSTFAGATNNAAYLTNGGSNGMSVASLNGGGRLTKWGDGVLYVRGASPSFSGPVVIDEGAIFVTNNQSLGSGAVSINRYGVLDVGVANYVATNSSTTYNAGSVERWSVDNARTAAGLGGSLNLGAATLQVGADQTGTVDVIMNGGSIEGYLRTDDVTTTQTDVGVFRNLGPNVTVNLAGNSFIGNQYYLGANGLDSGKQTNDYRPTAENIGTGTTLNIQGVISGVGGLTKAGYDTVILSGANSYTGGTTITGGAVRLGRTNALPTTGSVSTQADGVLDLNGYNQTVGTLTNPVNPTTPSTNSGYVTNSGPSAKTLTVGNGVGTNFTYAGIVEHNVGLSKVGTAQMTLSNANTYTGPTAVSAGVLNISGSINGTSNVQLDGGTLLLSGGTGEQVRDNADVNLNGGSLAFGNNANQTETLGALTLSATSMIDFGAAGGADKLLFSGGLFDRTTGILAIQNWVGQSAGISSAGIDGTDDRLVFSGNSIDFTSKFSQNDVSFNGGLGYQAINFTGGYEIVPVPEPSSTALIGAAGLLALVGYRERRRLGGMVARKNKING